jgi:ABC-2 type transport system permease protein
VVGGRFMGIGWLENLRLDLRLIAPLVVLFVPAYVMFAALMTTVGATFGEVQDAQGVMGVLILLCMIPVWLLQPIIEHPSSALALGLSLFPTTALPTLSIRVAFSAVPLWQIGASATVMVFCAWGAVWLAGRAFRLGMLRYGQNLNLGDFLDRRT